MHLSRHQTTDGPRWAGDGLFLAPGFSLSLLLQARAEAFAGILAGFATAEPASGERLAPIDPGQEVWASGVTYRRSRDARRAESATGDVYSRVYEAERPELFCKSLGWRVVGPGGQVRVRRDSRWNVPEPELTLVISRHLEIVGYCAGNDMSSRSIEGENPLYLPQAKIYDGSCALGPGLELASGEALVDLPIRLTIRRDAEAVFQGETRTSSMKRPLAELVAFLGRELAFPDGVFLMTGTGIVPPDAFSLQPADVVQITVGTLTIENPIGE